MGKLLVNGNFSYSLYTRESGRLMQTFDAPTNLTTNYIYLNNQMIARHQGNAITYLVTDRLGTPIAEADTAGNVTQRFSYDPYGGLTAGVSQQQPGFTGHVNDPESGLTYMQARYYDPNGHMISPDPIYPVAGDVFSFNRYSYADNNPSINTDPTGMYPRGPNEFQGPDDYHNNDPIGRKWWDNGCPVCADATGGKSTTAHVPTLKTIFVTAHLSDAEEAAGGSGVTAAEILGLAGLESGWGRGRFATIGNNFFGLHAPALYQTGAIPAAIPPVKMAVFNSFYTAAKSFVDRNNYLYGVKDPQEFAKDLQTIGKFGINKDGSPVPNYQKNLIKTINSVQNIINQGK